jgi:DNA end-binding protein Ku
MARSIWKGAIAFGLVHVPVALYPASQEDDIDFDWLDRRSMDPVGYQRVNKRTGKPIAKEDIVKGVKQDDGAYVLVDEDEIRAAYPKTTQTIEIERFVEADEIPVVYFEKPYALEPIARAEKVYALLRDAMAASGVIGVARLVMHSKAHLAALMPAGPALVLNTLRWSTEVRPMEELKLPAAGKGAGESELKMARQLIGELTGHWKPAEFHDHFAEDIRKLVAAKAAAGKSFEVTPMEPVSAKEAPSNVVDLSALLKQSLARRHGAAARAAPASEAAADEAANDDARTPARRPRAAAAARSASQAKARASAPAGARAGAKKATAGHTTPARKRA